MARKNKINQVMENLEADNRRMHSLMSSILNGHYQYETRKIRKHSPLGNGDGGTE